MISLEDAYVLDGGYAEPLHWRSGVNAATQPRAANQARRRTALDSGSLELRRQFLRIDTIDRSRVFQKQ